MSLPRVTVLHGPNLNLLGTREPHLYGSTTLAELDEALVREAAVLGMAPTCRHSNHEGVLVDWIQAARTEAEVLILNAGGYTHTSVALRDAVAAIAPAVPTIEVHLTIPEAREPFRHGSLLAGVVRGRIEGFGVDSYLLALRAASALIRARGVDNRDQ
ncbi:MAG: 3-dehydroquinate dehydratase [Deltaproteobacteria bacterium]|nr:3-dehydroquinate dehydratase [Deltaproteobacteria bacterium]